MAIRSPFSRHVVGDPLGYVYTMLASKDDSHLPNVSDEGIDNESQNRTEKHNLWTRERYFCSPNG